MLKQRVCLRITKKDHEDIEKAAEALDMTPSELVRHAVKEYNEKHLLGRL